MQDKLAEQTFTAWEAARRESERVRKQFVATGPVGLDGKIPDPPRVLGTQGMKEIQAAEEQEKAAWDAHQQAIGGLRRRR